MASNPAKEMRARLEETKARAETGDYFALLQVKRDASPADVKAAYYRLVKAVHPDRVGQLGLTGLHDDAARLFRVLTTAYQTLSDPVKRKEYTSGRVRGATASNPEAHSSQDEGRTEAAKIAFHKGSVYMTKRVYAEAERYFREATEAAPEVARYWQSLGWAVFHNRETRADERRWEIASKCYEKALSLDEEDAMTHYSVGLYWKDRGNPNRMRKAMDKAVELRPDFIEAKRELRLMKMRESKTTKGPRAARDRTKTRTTETRATAIDKAKDGGFLSRLRDAFKGKGKG